MPLPSTQVAAKDVWRNTYEAMITFVPKIKASMRFDLLIILCCGVGTSSSFAAPPPASTQPTALLVRANRAFNTAEYAIALPLLKELKGSYKDNPDKLAAVEEEIRVCQKNLDLPKTVPAQPLPDYSKRTPLVGPAAGQTISFASIKDLGNFDYEASKGGNIPADVAALSGTRIKVPGFMIPLDQAENISQFALVPSLVGCCQFGQPPQIQHTIVVHCPAGKAVSYFPDEISIVGILKVQERKEDGYITSVFELEVESVKSAPK